MRCLAVPTRPANQTRMQWHQKLAFSFGHILNDLCGAMWFSLLLVFLQYIVHFPANYAGYLMMWGQLVHAVSTPIIGYESDKLNGFCCFKKRKSWHFIGTIAVCVSFPFVFLRCIVCDEKPKLATEFLYYTPFIAVFQFGWASGQVAHMTLMSQLAQCSSDKMELSGFRNAGTLLSSIVVFAAGWGFFGPSKAKEWGESDESKFMLLMIIVIVTGVTCSVIFHLGLRERDDSAGQRPNDARSLHAADPNWISWLDWLKEPQFYLVSLLYMFSRLIVNVSGAYFPFYVFETLQMDKKFMSIIPLVMNLTGFVFSLLMRCITSRTGQKISLLVGVLLTLLGCVWLWSISALDSDPLQVTGPAIFIGASGSILTVTSLVMTTDVIGAHTVSGAFVFGAMSPMDKLASGLAILLIQQFSPCSWAELTLISAAYYNVVMVYVIGAFAAALLILMIFVWPQKLGQLRKASTHSISTVEKQNGEVVGADSNHCDDSSETRHLLDGYDRFKAPSIVIKKLQETWQQNSIPNGVQNGVHQTTAVIEDHTSV